MMKHTTITLAFVLSLIVAGTPASAQLLNANTSLDIMDPTQTGTGTQVLTDMLNTADSSATTSTETDSNAGTRTVGPSFSFNRNTMDESTSYGVTESRQVRSEASLESYAATAVRDTDRIESLELGTEGMRMLYRTDAKFLWFIPASLNTDIAIGTEGQVTARYPWYAFLMSTNETSDELASRIQSRIEVLAADTEGTTSADAGSNTEIRRWARILDRVLFSLFVEARAGTEEATPSATGT